jgi:hypothetical protein
VQTLVCSAAVTALFAAGCHTGSANTFAGAASFTALAIGAAAVSRASGGCIAVCTNGTACNPATGFCEVLPCRGRCEPDEHCEVAFSSSRCMPGSVASVAKEAKGTERTIPLAPPPPPPNSSGPPVIVPKAEEPH